MNTNDISFEMHVNALKANIIEGLKNNSSQMFAHLSHDDLDGFGCTVISYLQQWYLQRTTKHTNIPQMMTHNFIWKNTNQLNEKMYPVLDELLVEASATTHHRRINVLITDLGGINVETLVSRYRNFNYGNVRFMIIDHHRSIYQSIPAQAFGDNMTSVYHDSDDNTIVSYRDGSRFQLDMYITNGKISATKALHNLLRQGHEPRAMDIFANTVSKYDTGNVGNWKIPANKYGDRAYIAEHTSDQVKLNSWWKCAYQDQRDHASSMVKFIYEVASTIGTAETFCSMKDKIYDRIVLINEQYIKFCENLEVIERTPGHNLMYGKGKTLKIPECADHVKSFAVYWHDDPAELYPPLTMYSKVYLVEHPEVDVLMVANEIHHSVDTRSLKEEINVYDICVTNNGGGHPHAAGCPMN